MLAVAGAAIGNSLRLQIRDGMCVPGGDLVGSPLPS